jgi:hypothetical protein
LAAAALALTLQALEVHQEVIQLSLGTQQLAAVVLALLRAVLRLVYQEVLVAAAQEV